MLPQIPFKWLFSKSFFSTKIPHSVDSHLQSLTCLTSIRNCSCLIQCLVFVLIRQVLSPFCLRFYNCSRVLLAHELRGTEASIYAFYSPLGNCLRYKDVTVRHYICDKYSLDQWSHNFYETVVMNRSVAVHVKRKAKRQGIPVVRNMRSDSMCRKGHMWTNLTEFRYRNRGRYLKRPIPVAVQLKA
jgi:hypothetical protein